jgi:hypothetical protein
MWLLLLVHRPAYQRVFRYGHQSVAIPFSLLLAFALPAPGVDKPGNGFNPS